jgi:hypothetical protein
MTFTQQQRTFIAQGGAKHNQLVERINVGLGIKQLKVEASRHTYISGAAGLGKSFTVQQAIKQVAARAIKVSGATSMAALARNLALAVYLHNRSGSKEALVVWVDDCDSILMDMTALNVMKGAMDTNDDPAFTWDKDVSTDIVRRSMSPNPADQLLAEAMQHFQFEGARNIVGLRIPTSNVRFVITSNRRLKTSADVLNSKRHQDEAAVARRAANWHIDLDDQEHWGWLASVTMQMSLFSLEQAQKEELLSWLWDNWSRVPGKDLSFVNELGAMMVNYPADYLSQWSNLLKK